jgi:hypothetical protein
MLQIAIDRVQARYRIPRQALREQARIQRILDDALNRVLEGAVEREGVPPGAYVCIQDMHAVTTVDLRDPDSALATGVAGAIAVAIRRLIDEQSPSVVQYGSRVHALIDLASNAIEGDFSRSWAWAQVGIWRSDFPLRADMAADLVVRALAKEPTHAAAVVAHLARECPERLRALIARATPNAWEALVRAAAREGGRGGFDTAVIGRAAGEASTLNPDRSDQPTSLDEAVAIRVARNSAIARVASDVGTSLSDASRVALAVLALLEVEPVAVPRDAETIRVLASLVRKMSPAGASSAVRLVDSDDRRTGIEAQCATGPHDVEPVPHVRRLARTESGGLLYLVNLLDRMRFSETLRTDALWSERGLRWVLHQLAMALARIDAEDPAALVFAGLMPDAALPSSLQDAPTGSERAAVERLRATVVGALRETLDVSTAPHAESDQVLLDRVCRRVAHIAADPGWIEARFSLDDVSLDIRRAALDLNPDWVPWLGVVLRFVYA